MGVSTAVVVSSAAVALASGLALLLASRGGAIQYTSLRLLLRTLLSAGARWRFRLPATVLTLEVARRVARRHRVAAPQQQLLLPPPQRLRLQSPPPPTSPPPAALPRSVPASVSPSAVMSALVALRRVAQRPVSAARRLASSGSAAAAQLLGGSVDAVQTRIEVWMGSCRGVDGELRLWRADAATSHARFVCTCVARCL
jgi:hypothetical protein